MKHYAIEIRVKNNYFLTKMHEAGFDTVAALSKACGIYPADIGEIVNLKRAAKTRNNEWRNIVQRLADILRCLPEDLFPPQHIESPLNRNKSVFLANAVDIDALTTSLRSDPIGRIESKQTIELLSHMLKTLNPRERKVVEDRYGLIDGEVKTLDTIAGDLGVGRERVRQIERRALERLENRYGFSGIKHSYQA